MPKLKTKKSMAKRFKFSKKRKIMRPKAGRRHLLSGRSQKRKRLFRKKAVVASVERQSVQRGMPYA